MVTSILIIAIIIAYIFWYLISNIKTRKILKLSKKQNETIEKQSKTILTTVNKSNEIFAEFQKRVSELEKHLHKEQVDSNNKERSRDKWKAKFKTAEKILKDNKLEESYKINWQKEVIIFNKK